MSSLLCLRILSPIRIDKFRFISIISEDRVRVPNQNFVALEDVDMATVKAPTKAEFLEALSKNGIKTLEDLVDALLPSETGGYLFQMYISEGNEDAERWLKSKLDLWYGEG